MSDVMNRDEERLIHLGALACYSAVMNGNVRNEQDVRSAIGDCMSYEEVVYLEEQGLDDDCYYEGLDRVSGVFEILAPEYVYDSHGFQNTDEWLASLPLIADVLASLRGNSA